MSDGLNYPDTLYADHLAKQTPTGAYDSANLTDAVSKPPHYDLGKYQAIDVIVEVAKTIDDPVEATFASHMLKYALRWPRKGGLQDLYKERQYLDWLIAHVEQRTGGVDTLGRTSEGLAKRIHDQALAADIAWSAKRGDYPAPNDWCVHVTPAAWADPQAENIKLHRRVASAEELRSYGIGDVGHDSDFTVDSAGYFHFENIRHPMAAEADRLSAEGMV